MDIIVTTPKSEMAAAAAEAEDVKRAGGGEYFRRFRENAFTKPVRPDERVYYVEDGYIRGFCVVSRVILEQKARQCETTDRRWPPGLYVFMDATTWQWIRPIPMRGFQGYRYAKYKWARSEDFTDVRRGEGLVIDGRVWNIEIVGGWQDPKPAVNSGRGA